jgi:hypothetical protein
MDDQAVLVGGSHLLENQHLREGKRGRMDYRLYSLAENGAPDMHALPTKVLKVSRIAPACDDELVVFAAPPPTRKDNKGKEREVYKTGRCTVGLNTWKITDFIKEGRGMQLQPFYDEVEKKGWRVSHPDIRQGLFRNLNYGGHLWQKADVDVNALALSADAVLVAHPGKAEAINGWGKRANPRESLMTYGDWRITAYAREDGTEKWSVALPSEPLQNGIAIAADGSILVALRDGSIACVK